MFNYQTLALRTITGGELYRALCPAYSHL